MKRKSIASIMLVALMILSLVGCGDKNSNQTYVPNNTNKTETTTENSTKAENNNNGDAVVGDQSGVSGPKDEIEDKTEEPETEPIKNIITLMSADDSMILNEWNIPDGYTVVSNKTSSKIELTKNDNEYVKIEIFSGANYDALYALGHSPAGWVDSTLTEKGYVYAPNTELIKIANQLNINIHELENTHYYYESAYSNLSPYQCVFNDYEDAWGENASFEIIRDDYVRIFDYYMFYQNNDGEINYNSYAPANETWTVKVTVSPTTDNPDELPEFHEVSAMVDTIVKNFMP